MISRYGSGFTLQAKVKLSAPPKEDPTLKRTGSRLLSLIRSGSKRNVVDRSGSRREVMGRSGSKMSRSGSKMSRSGSKMSRSGSKKEGMIPRLMRYAVHET